MADSTDDDEINVLVFRDDRDLKPLLTNLGLHISSKGKVHRPEGELVRCDGCDTAITLNNLGHIMPGSELFYCTDAACVLKYFVEHA